MKKYRIVSLFSGAGGFDLGFLNNNFEIVWANDSFIEAVETYKHNIGNHIVLGDITKIKSEEIPDDIDVVIGGFPCQGFSIANGKRHEKDERNFLYKEMLRIIKDKNPKIFVAENVKGILSLANGKVFELIKNDFKKLGYELDYKVLDASKYGVPQKRERVIIIGNKIKCKNIFPEETHGANKKKEKTVEESISFLKNVKLQNEMQIVDKREIYNHLASTNVKDKFFGRKYEVNQAEICDFLKKYRNNSKWTTNKIDEYFGYKHTAGHWFRKDNKSGCIPKPEDWWKLKKILKFDNKYDKVVTTFVEKEIKFEQSLRITNWDRPSDTITATLPEIHISKNRRLSARECAILQTFPDNHIFYGTLSKIYTQIGNAVPVMLADKIAKEIQKMLEESENNDN
ncbi:MAG: DNA cytosine methyltransferase [Mycoplasmatales bacterium]